MFGKRGHMIRLRSNCEHTPGDARVNRLHPAIENFREAGEIGDIPHCQARFLQRARGASGGYEFHSHRSEAARKFGDSDFIGDAQKSAFDLWHETYIFSRRLQ